MKIKVIINKNSAIEKLKINKEHEKKKVKKKRKIMFKIFQKKEINYIIL
jgi:hypothetical protein